MTVRLGALAALLATAATAQTLTIGVQALPDSLDPASENSNVNLRIMHSVFETLIKTDYRDGGALKPGLATAWRVIDARTIEFTLREGVTFHNGDTLDAADVVATFAPVRRGEDETVPVDTVPFIGGIDRVEVIDDMTVRIHMQADDAIIANRFASFPSQIISADAFEAAETYADFAAAPVGTGPYRIAGFELGERVTLEAFDGYWGEATAAAETVAFVATPEPSTRVAGLLSGQFDIITEVGPDQIPQLEAAANAEVVGGPIENIRGLIYDSTNPVLEDPRIRQALNLAIDRELIVETLYQGRTSVPQGWQMDIFGEMYLADRPIPAHDVEAAKALLAEAGYDGEAIVYRTQPGYYTNQGETAQILQAMWAEAGLNVDVRFVENWDQVLQDDDELMIFDGSFTAYYPDPMGQFWRRFGPNGGWARNGYYVIDEEMLALGETLATSVDIEERRWTFAEMLERFEVDPHGAALHMLTQIYGVNTGSVSFSPMATQYMDLTTTGISFK